MNGHSKRWALPWYGVLALIILLGFIGIALAAPLLAPIDRATKSGSFSMVRPPIARYPNPPSADYPLGTVPIGRMTVQIDVYHTLIWGTRSALLFGLTAALIISIFGSLVGALSSYLGGSLAQIILRITDGFLAFPVIAGIVFLGQLLSPRSLLSEPSLLQASLQRMGVDNVMLALIFLGWMPYARVIYADIERIRQVDYVVAAQSAGARPGRIIFRHLIPNAISNVIVLATRDVSGLVLLQATFTFIGVGGNSDWGELLALGRNWIIGPGGNPLNYWWVFVPVTVALVGFGITWNLLGDFINEALNPRLRYFIPD